MLKQVTLVATLAFLPTVFGHGNIIVPPPTGDADHIYYFGGPAGTINMPEIIGDETYGNYYLGVEKWFAKKGITTLKQYITTYSTNISECGNTVKHGTPEAIPSDGYAVHTTLGNSHPGPCEIWCDNKRVFHNINCVTEFSGQSPAKIPIPVATCKASSEFVFYWLALHAQPWQVYINCVALNGTTASYSSDSTSTTSTSTTTTTTLSPASTPTSTDASASTTTAPTTTTTAPSSQVTASSTSTGGEAETTTTTSAPTSASTTTATAEKCSRRKN